MNTQTKTAQEQATTWTNWRDLLSLEEQEEIARKTGLVDQAGNVVLVTARIAREFDQACDQAALDKITCHSEGGNSDCLVHPRP